MEAEARANKQCSSFVRWAEGKQLAIAPKKSSVTLFTSDTDQSLLHPQVWIGDAVAVLNRTPKIFTFVSHARDCVERVSRAHSNTKSLAGSNWGLTTKTLVATYKAIVRPSLTTPIPSGSPKCPQHTWLNLRWSWTRLWGPWPVAIKRPRRPFSQPRLRSSSSPPEGALRTVLSPVLCQRPPTQVLMAIPPPIDPAE